MKECFGDGQETVLFVTGLTRNTHAAALSGSMAVILILPAVRSFFTGSRRESFRRNVRHY